MAEETDRNESTPPPPSAEKATGDLIREAIEETRQLVELEVALAREEVRGEIVQAKLGGIVMGAAAGAGLCGFTVCLVGAALTFSDPALAALAMGGSLLSLAVVGGFAGWKALPKRPLNETRARLESDLKQLKERVV
jgi:hypothetical protein